MQASDAGVWAALPQPFLAREAFAAGLTSTSIAGAMRRRQIIPVARSVYAVPEAWVELGPPQLHLAMTRAAFASVPDSVVSHQSAALVFGPPYPLGPIGRPTVTVPESSRSSAKEDWRRVLHAELPPDHVMMRHGIKVTTPARTVLDALRQLRLRDALAIADGAVRAELVTLTELEDMRRFQTRWPGVRNADKAFGLVDHRRESWLESASVATAHALGFSRPESQVWIHHPDGRLIGRVDLLWRRAGVIGEADGRGKYLGEFSGDWDADRAAQFMLAERDRERELESVGLAVARWGPVSSSTRDAGSRRFSTRRDGEQTRSGFGASGARARATSSAPGPSPPFPLGATTNHPTPPDHRQATIGKGPRLVSDPWSPGPPDRRLVTTVGQRVGEGRVREDVGEGCQPKRPEM